MNRKPAASAPRTWHSLWDEMFSAVVELDPTLGQEDDTAGSALDVARDFDHVTAQRDQAANDNAGHS